MKWFAALCVCLAALPVAADEVVVKHCALFKRLPLFIPQEGLPHITMSADLYTFEEAHAIARWKPEWEVLCKGTPEWQERLDLLAPRENLPRLHIDPQ